MPRPGSLLRALAAVAAVAVLSPVASYAVSGPREGSTGEDRAPAASRSAGSGTPTPTGAAAADTEATPLTLTIDGLRPGAIPKHGSVHISGTVTNNDTQTWTDVHVYPFISGTPMTTSAELSAAAAADPTVPVGSRITSVRDDVGDLTPGETVTYSITIPRSELVYNDPDTGAAEPITAPGVYWFGAEGRDLTADGRARTFLPLVPTTKNATPAKVSLLLPVRRLVHLAPDGSVTDLDSWIDDLTRGQLARVVSFGSGALDVTWLVDPAVLDAVRRLAAGNPGRDLTAASAPTTGPSASASASASSTPTATTAPAPSASPSGSSSETAVDPTVAAAKQAATSWLAAFKQATINREVLSLPYGDPDLSAVAAHLRSAYPMARAQSDAVFKDLGIASTPVSAPLSGYLSSRGLSMVGSKTPVLIGSQGVAGSPGSQVRVNGTVLDVLSTRAAEGGPGPGDPLAPIALRQRLLAEASLRYDRPGKPLVVAMPVTWLPPASSASYASAFDSRWVDVQPLTSAESEGRPTPIGADDLLYPQAEADAEVTPSTLAQVRSLMAAGTTLNNVLPDHPTVAAQVAAQALTSTSYSARGGDGGAALAAQRNIESLLSQIHIDPPTAVTLSSASGRFSVSVDNDMPQPVSVQLRAVSDHGIQISGPEALRIAAGDTTTVLMTADAHTNGVHQITLELVDSQGHRVGQPVRFPIRSSEVSGTIWLFVGVGVGLLFIAIVVRLARRVRTNRRAADHAEVS